MRYSFFLIGLLIILFSCNSSLVVSEIKKENISNEPTALYPDSSIIQLVLPYKQNLEGDMSKVISISNEELTKAKPESKLTNLMADFLLNAGNSYCNESNKGFVPDMAFVNYGGLRVSLPRGEITVGNIFELMPFENEMVLLKLTGKTMLEFAQQIAARGGDGVAGITLGIKDGAVGTFNVGGEAFDQNKDYWVVTNDYIANGGDDMKMLVDRKDFVSTGLKIRSLIIESLNNQYKAGNRIQVQLDGRIYNE